MTTSRRRTETAALLALRDAFPRAFPPDDAALQPLAISTGDDLAAWAATRPDLDLKYLRRALQHHCARTTYRRTLTVGCMRITLHGADSEPVTAQAEQLARATMEQEQEARAQSAAARAARSAAALEEQRRLQEAAAIRRAAKAAQPPKTQASQPPAPVPAPAPAAPPAKPRPIVVIKKRRSLVRGGS